MTKEEKIKEAYGDYWNDYNKYVNENGWLTSLNSEIHYCLTTQGRILRALNDKSNIDFDEVHDSLRPKSLQGIEDNNGWIKIENDSERFTDEDLWICNFNGNKQAFFHNAFDVIPKSYTHYQQIKKPKAPIY